MESSESMEPRGYEGEGPIETGRLPESERFESGSNVIFGDDVEKRLQEGSVPGGP